MFSLLLLSATVTAAQPFRLESSGSSSDAAVFAEALNAPERARDGKDRRFCVKVEGDPARDTVCRSKLEWRRLGVEPLLG